MGVLVRPRMNTLNPEEVTGYAVACAPAGWTPPRRRAGLVRRRQLAPDLTFPQLEAHWCREGAVTRQAATTTAARTCSFELDPSERQALWDVPGQALGRADEQLRAAAGGDPASRAMADAGAVAASEILAEVGRLTERSGPGLSTRRPRSTTGRPAGCAAERPDPRTRTRARDQLARPTSRTHTGKPSRQGAVKGPVEG